MTAAGKRHSVAFAWICLAAFGCQCGDLYLLKKKVPRTDLMLQAEDAVSCGGKPLRMQAVAAGGTAPYAWRWEPAEGLSDPNSPTPIASGTRTREYTLTVKDKFGVAASQKVRVERRELPALSLRLPERTLCSGDQITFDGTATRPGAEHGSLARLTWEVDGQVVRDGLDATLVYAPVDGQRLALTAVDEVGCSARTELPLHVRPLPQAALGFLQGGAHVCGPEEVELAVTSRDADGASAAEVSWDFDGDPATREAAGPRSGSFRPHAGHPVTAFVTDTRGCRTSVRQEIAISPLPVPAIRFAQGEPLTCSGRPVALDGAASHDGTGQPVASYQWEIGGFAQPLTSTAAQPPGFTVSGAHPVTLMVRSAAGCSAAAETTVVARPLPEVKLDFLAGRERPCAGSEVVLGAAASRDADGRPVTSVLWDLDSDGRIDSTLPVAPGFVPAGPQVAKVIVADDLGCASSASVAIEPRALPVPALRFEVGSGAVCAGDSVLLSGADSRDADGAPVASFAWDLDGDPGSVESSAESSGAFVPAGAPVRLTVADAQGCAASVDRTITVHPLPLPSLTFVQGSPAVCAGTRIQLDASGSTDAFGRPVYLEWSTTGAPGGLTVAPGGAAASFDAEGEREVTLRAVDTNGCFAERSARVLARPNPVAEIAFASGRFNACRGDTISLNGTSSFDTDGSRVASWSWTYSSGGLDRAFSGELTPAFVPDDQVVRLVVQDVEGCTAEATVAVAPRAPPTAQFRFTAGAAALCAGDEVDLDAGSSSDVDGQPVASYAWDLDGDRATVERTGAVTGPFLPPSGTVRLSVTDVLGCVASTEQTLDVRGPPVARLAFLSGAPQVCAGTEVRLDGSLSTDSLGRQPARFEWDLDGDPSTVESTAMRPPGLTPAGAVPVRLRVYDERGCEAEASQVLSARPNPSLTLSFAAGSASVCSGERVVLSAAGSTDADGALPLRLEWDTDGNPATPEGTGTLSPELFLSSSRDVTVRAIDDFGCSTSRVQPLTARARPIPRVRFEQGRADVCLGDGVRLAGDGSTDAAGSPVAAYAWDLGSDGSVEHTTALTPVFVPVTPTTVRLTVQDATGCDASITQAIAPRALPSAEVTFTAGSAAICAGDTVSLTAAASRDADGSPVDAYAWDLDGNASTIEQTTAATSGFVPAGSPVTVTVTDVRGCRASRTQAIDVGALPTAAIGFAAGAASVCAGDSVVLDGSASRRADGGPVAGYEWDFDGTWSTEEGTAAQSPSLVPSGSLLARLRVRDLRGCTAQTSVSLSTRPLPTARIAFAEGRTDVCLGDSVRLSGTGSTDAAGNPVAGYSWDLDGDGNFDASMATTPALIPSGPRAIHLEVTDQTGCKASATQAIAPRALPSADIAFLAGSPALCPGDSVRLSGAGSRDQEGNPVLTWAWDLDGDGSSDASGVSPEAFVPAADSVIGLRVTDGRGCIGVAATNVSLFTSPTPLITFVEGDSAICAGEALALSGAASRDAAGGPVVAYAWSTDVDVGAIDSTGATTGRFVPTSSGTATLRVRDSNGCSATATQPFTVRPLPIALAGANAAVCPGGSVTLGSAAQPGLTYAWSPTSGLSSAAAAAPVATPAADTTYRLAVTDSFGCRAEDSVHVRLHPVPTADAGPDLQVARGGAVQLLSQVSGGTPPYGHSWSPATGLDDASHARPWASPGADATYELAVTDANGCFDRDEVRISVVDPLLVSAGADRRLCETGSGSLTLSASASGGVGPLSFSWVSEPDCGCISDPTGASISVRPGVTTDFTVTVRDANGMTVSDTVRVSVVPAITADAGPDRQLRAGQTTQLGAPPEPGLTYEWTCSRLSCGLSDYEASDPFASPVGTTLYTLTVTDGATCTATDNVSVIMDPQIVASVPPDGVNWWNRSAPLWVLFDTDLDPASIPGNVRLIDEGDGGWIWINVSYDPAYRMLHVQPLTSCTGTACAGGSAYKNNRPYVLRLKGGPGGITTAGPHYEPLYNDRIYPFVASSEGDGSAPTALFTFPAKFATGVSRNASVEVKFDEPLDPRTVHSGTIWIDGAPAQVFHDPRSYTVTLRPHAPLAANRTYTVRIQGIKDAPGNALTTSWNFTTGAAFDTQAPAVTSATPAHGATGVQPDALFRVTFSEPIDLATLQRVLVEDLSSGMPLTGQVAYDVATRTLTFEPRTLLEPGRTYRLHVSDLEDHAGHLIRPAADVDFTVGPALLLERFEGGLIGWTLQSGWAADFQASHAEGYGLSDSPGGNYPAGLNAAAISPRLDVTGRSSVQLTFWSRRLLQTSAPSHTDVARVEYSLDGTTWLAVTPALLNSDGWRRHSYPITTGGSPNLWLRFRLTTDATVNLEGWHLDDLLVR